MIDNEALFSISHKQGIDALIEQQQRRKRAELQERALEATRVKQGLMVNVVQIRIQQQLASLVLSGTLYFGEDFSVLDSFLWTLCTVTTVGYGGRVLVRLVRDHLLRVAAGAHA